MNILSNIDMQTAGFMGGYEWVLIVAVVILLFGGKKIPELMKGIGGGIKEFKNATKEGEKPQEKLDQDKKED
jgi:sec-independent protein translocase protein TatA